MMAVGFPTVGHLRGAGCIPNEESLERDLRQCTRALSVSGAQQNHFAIKHCKQNVCALRFLKCLKQNVGSKIHKENYNVKTNITLCYQVSCNLMLL